MACFKFFFIGTGFVQTMENVESHGINFKNFIFQAWKVMEFNYRCKKVMENQSFVW